MAADIYLLVLYASLLISLFSDIGISEILQQLIVHISTQNCLYSILGHLAGVTSCNFTQIIFLQSITNMRSKGPIEPVYCKIGSIMAVDMILPVYSCFLMSIYSFRKILIISKAGRPL
ncbi:unnamed protein product [Musa textilis]